MYLRLPAVIPSAATILLLGVGLLVLTIGQPAAQSPSDSPESRYDQADGTRKGLQRALNSFVSQLTDQPLKLTQDAIHQLTDAKASALSAGVYPSKDGLKNQLEDIANYLKQQAEAQKLQQDSHPDCSTDHESDGTASRTTIHCVHQETDAKGSSSSSQSISISSTGSSGSDSDGP
jgi:hypothetical protein